MKRVAMSVFSLLMMVLFAFTSCQKDSTDVKSMSGDDLVKKNSGKEKDKMLVIDVRPAEQYKEGHIPHAVNILFSDIDAKISRIEEWKNKPVVVYCNTGNKSGQAAKALLAQGFTDVYNADGVKKYEYELITYSDILADDLLTMANAEDVVLVDYRPTELFEKGHIDGAINIPLDGIQANLDKLPKDKKIVVYCNTGTKSALAAKELSGLGYPEVYNAIIGIKEHKFDLVQ